MVQDLLKPSLQAARPAIAIYSTRASFFVAFLGGPLAIVLFTGLNSRRLGRLREDGPWLVLGGAIAVAATLTPFVLMDAASGADRGLLTAQNMRIASRALAILICGGYYLMHRAQHRSMQFLGLDPPEPWEPGVLCAIPGLLIGVVQRAVLTMGVTG